MDGKFTVRAKAVSVDAAHKEGNYVVTDPAGVQRSIFVQSLHRQDPPAHSGSKYVAHVVTARFDSSGWIEIGQVPDNDAYSVEKALRAGSLILAHPENRAWLVPADVPA